MNIGYPIYLIRIFSSIFVGILTMDIIFYEIFFYMKIINFLDKQPNQFIKQIYSFFSIKDILLFFQNTSFFEILIIIPFIFFIGEFFSTISEIFVFDPFFSNLRIYDTNHYLELVGHNLNKKRNYILLGFIPFILYKYKLQNNKNEKEIKISKFVYFMQKYDRPFAMSEMYFNLHRIMGGSLIVFWLLFVFYLLLFIVLLIWYRNWRWVIDFLLDFLFLVFNYLMVCYTLKQGISYRRFANNLIFWSS